MAGQPSYRKNLRGVAGPKPIAVLLVDKHAAFRQPLAFLFQREHHFTVVGQAGSLAEAREKLNGVDLALIDETLPDGNGIELIEALHAASPHSRVLLLTDRTNRPQSGSALPNGAATILDKSASLNDLLGSARRMGARE